MVAALRALPATLVLAGLIQASALAQLEARWTDQEGAAPDSPVAVLLGSSASRPLLEASLRTGGFSLLEVEGPEGYGAPRAVEQLLELLKEEVGARRALLVGFDLGGLTVLNTAATSPRWDRPVLAVDAVCDIKSRPAGWGGSEPDPEAWARCLELWGLTSETVREHAGNPIDRPLDLAMGQQAVGLAFGRYDSVRPPGENSQRFAKRLRDLGAAPFVLESPSTEALAGTMEAEASRTAAERLVAWALARLEPGGDVLVARRGLPRAAKRLQSGERITVAFLGGSLTEAAGWRPIVTRTLGRRTQERVQWFPAGRASFDSTGDAVRLREDLFSQGKPDVVILDCAVNDAANGRTAVEVVRGIEGILAHMQREFPGSELVLVHLADEGKLAARRADRVPFELEAARAVADHHGLPTIEVSDWVARSIAAGELDWKEDFGEVHPKPRGHTIYARLVEHGLDRLLAGGAGASGTVPEAWLDEASYGGFEPLPLETAQDLRGFRLIPSWRPTDGVGVRRDYVAGPVLEGPEPGAELSVPFEGTQVAVVVTSGPDAGLLGWSLDGGPWQQVDLVTPWSRGLHLPWTHVLEAELAPGPHLLRIRSEARGSDVEAGTTVRIHRLLAGDGCRGVEPR